MSFKLSLLPIVLLLAACSKHTEFTLETSSSDKQIKYELQNALQILNFNPDVQIDDKSITVIFNEKLDKIDNQFFVDLLNNSISKNKNTGSTEVKLNITEKNKFLLSNFLKSSKGKDSFSLTPLNGASLSYLFSQRNENKKICALSIPIEERLPPLSIDPTQKTGKRTALEQMQILALLGERHSYAVNYEIKLDDEDSQIDNIMLHYKPIKLRQGDEYIDAFNNSLVFKFSQYEFESRSAYDFSPRSTAADPTDISCGHEIYKKLSGRYKKVFITPKLSKVLVSFKQEDTFF